jgi:hypothetical protein
LTAVASQLVSVLSAIKISFGPSAVYATLQKRKKIANYLRLEFEHDILELENML